MHKSKMTCKWLRDNHIDTFPHPPSSPDMNPIEPVWWELKKGIRSRPFLPTTVDSLCKATVNVWEALRQEDIDKYTQSMSDRVEAVIAAKGARAHTPY
jgi:transposase